MIGLTVLAASPLVQFIGPPRDLCRRDHLLDTGEPGGAHHCSGAHTHELCFAAFAPVPGSARHPSCAIASFRSQFQENSFVPPTPTPEGLAQERWLCRPAMPAPPGQWPRQPLGCLLPTAFARRCVARRATSDTNLPLCRYHEFRYKPRSSPDAVLGELNGFRDLRRTRIGALVCPEC